MLERINPTLTLNNSTAAADSDPTETAEWLDALKKSVFRMEGGERAEFILSALDRKAKDLGVVPNVLPFGPYRNTIPLEKQGAFPATSKWRRASRRSFAGMPWRWSCARTRPMANSADMSRAKPPPPRFSRSASIISSVARRGNRGAMSSSSSLTRPQASTLAPSSRAG